MTLLFGHTSLVDYVAYLPLYHPHVVFYARQFVVLYVLHYICCEFRVRSPGLCSLPPLYLVKAKPEGSWITVQPNRAVVRVAHCSHSPDTFSGCTWTRRLLSHYNFRVLGRLSLQLQARHLGIAPRRPIHQAFQAIGPARHPSWNHPMS